MPNDTLPLNALKQAMEARKEAQQAASGGLPMPSSTPSTPMPTQSVPPAGPPMGGLMAAAPQQMPPDQRAQFAQDTGIAANPGATDINLGVDPAELARRADALINRYK